MVVDIQVLVTNIIFTQNAIVIKLYWVLPIHYYSVSLTSLPNVIRTDSLNKGDGIIFCIS